MLERREIVTTIRRLASMGEPLNLHAAKRHHPELVKAAFAIRPFLGWKAALREAGVEYDDIRVELLDVVKCRLCEFCGADLSSHLRHRHGLSVADYSSRFSGAAIRSEARLHRLFRKREMTPKGQALPHWEPLYSEEYLMDRIAEYRRLGQSIRLGSIRRCDHNLWQQVHRLGYKWPVFCARLGPEYAAAAQGEAPHRERNTSEVCLRMLQEQAVDGVAPVRRKIEQTREGKLLLSDLRYHFFNYTSAVKTAGLLASMGFGREPTAYRPHAAEVLGRLTERCSEGKSCHKKDLAKEPEGALLIRAALAHFGTWRGALAAAGIGPKDSAKRNKTPPSGRPPESGRKTTLTTVVSRPEEESLAAGNILEILRDRARRGLSLSTSALRTMPKGMSTYLAARHIFGSWHNALHAAGLDPKAVGATRRRTIKSARDKPAPSIVKPVRRRGDSGGEDAPLDQFLHPRGNPQSERFSIIMDLRRRAAEGKGLSYGTICLGPPALRDRDLYQRAVRQFGNWKSALREANVR